MAEAAAASAASHVAEAKKLAERVRNGEAVAISLGPSITRKEAEAILIAEGLTKADIQFIDLVSTLTDEQYEGYNAAVDAARDRAEKAVKRAMLRKHARERR